MEKQILVYRTIRIYEDYGYFSPSIDRTVESMYVHKIIEWIDEFWGSVRKPKIDYYIIGDFVMRQPFLNN